MCMLPFRLPSALDSSSSDSDTDGAKATWKATPEDSKPKHQQVQRFCSVDVDNNHLLFNLVFCFLTFAQTWCLCRSSFAAAHTRN